MKDKNHKICSKRVMDTSDPGISFDEYEVCDYRHNLHKNILPSWLLMSRVG